MAEHSLWEDHKGLYRGAYTIELMSGAATDHVPTSASVSGNTVSVPVGTVQQVMGGIQFRSAGQPFAWGYKYIKVIRDKNDDVLWKNWNAK